MFGFGGPIAANDIIIFADCPIGARSSLIGNLSENRLLTCPSCTFTPAGSGREKLSTLSQALTIKILTPDSAPYSWTARARELENFEVPYVSLDEVRKMYGSPSRSDKELILRFYAGPEFVDALKSAPPRKKYLDARKPLVKLVEELRRKRLGHVYIRKGDFSLSIGRHG